MVNFIQRMDLKVHATAKNVLFTSLINAIKDTADYQ